MLCLVRQGGGADLPKASKRASQQGEAVNQLLARPWRSDRPPPPLRQVQGTPPHRKLFGHDRLFLQKFFILILEEEDIC